MSTSALNAWENFYIIVGSSAGALTGLLFVVISLVAGRRRQAVSWGTGTFTTPTVVQFSAVLGVSALLSAPWPALLLPALLLGLTGLAGIGYSAIVFQRMRRRIDYDPVREDWLWFVIAPLLASFILLLAAVVLPVRPDIALFGVGAVLLFLLLAGIRNAWDLATYIGIEGFPGHSEPHPADSPDDAPSASPSDVGGSASGE